MLFDRHRVIGATLDGRVICYDDALLPLDQSYTGNNASRRSVVIIHVPGSQRAKLQEGRIGIAEELDTFARQQLVTFAMLLNGVLTSALLNLLNIGLKLIQKLLEIACVLLEFRAAAVDARFDNSHKSVYSSPTTLMEAQHSKYYDSEL